MKLFGTDGVRGVANQWLTPELAFFLGRSFSARLLQTAHAGGKKPRVMVGRDTRMSGPMLQSAFIAGCNSVGVDCAVAGVIPTPAVAYLTRSMGYDAGVMISASHNPVEDNGIKIFSRDGMKLSDEEELHIEALAGELLQGDDRLPRPIGGEVGDQMILTSGPDQYIGFVTSAFPVDLTGLRIVLDCGHGAAHQVAPQVLTQLGAEVVTINAEPNGKNINVRCGSTFPEVIQEAVRHHDADVGFAFDGDADRVIAVDEKGGVLTGDHIIVVLADYFQKLGTLGSSKVVVTPYSNGGLEKALAKRGIEVIYAPTGDRNVLEAMIREGSVLGGEQSGHIILLSHNPAGDGLLSVLALLAAQREAGAKFSVLAQMFQPVPQVHIGVQVKNKEGLEKNEPIRQCIEDGQNALRGRGRLFVRASGTEPVIRILAEGDDETVLHQVVDRVAQIVAAELG